MLAGSSGTTVIVHVTKIIKIKPDPWRCPDLFFRLKTPRDQLRGVRGVLALVGGGFLNLEPPVQTGSEAEGQALRGFGFFINCLALAACMRAWMMSVLAWLRPPAAFAAAMTRALELRAGIGSNPPEIIGVLKQINIIKGVKQIPNRQDTIRREMNGSLTGS